LDLYSSRSYRPSLYRFNRRFGTAHPTTSQQSHSLDEAIGRGLKLAASLEVASLAEARTMEREMKHNKNPQLSLYLLQQRGGNIVR